MPRLRLRPGHSDGGVGQQRCEPACRQGQATVGAVPTQPPMPSLLTPRNPWEKGSSQPWTRPLPHRPLVLKPPKSALDRCLCRVLLTPLCPPALGLLRDLPEDCFRAARAPPHSVHRGHSLPFFTSATFLLPWHSILPDIRVLRAASKSSC